MRFTVSFVLGLAAAVSAAHAEEPAQPVVLKAAYLFVMKHGQVVVQP